MAAKKDYKDRVTGEMIPAVTTAQIYKGSIAFIILQLIMVAVVIAYPGLVSDSLGKDAVSIDADAALDKIQAGREALQQIPMGQEDPASSPAGGASAPAKDDPMAGLLDALKQDAQKQDGEKK